MEANANNKSGLKAGVQKLGSYLSSMVMPNIGAFIAWGIITALFIPDGWIPNEELSSLVDPMVTYLLPLLIGYSGGKMVHDKLGGVIGAIGTMGVIVGSQVPMFIGAMIIGPFSGWVIKKFDEAFFDKVPSGFEMLVNNFSVGILGFFIAIAGYLGVGPLVTAFTNLLGAGVETIVSMGLLPLANVFIEPAKILFLNNAINHGILTPLGTQQVAEAGRSVLFLLEANPGPGLGVLLAFLTFGKGSSKSSASGAAIIHFFGGIHEIYFPYVLMKPLMFLAVIAGGVAGTFTFQLFDVGLSGAASPGSIIAILGMAPQGHHLGIILGVAISALVSFLIGMLVIKLDRSAEEDNLEEAQAATQAAKIESKGQSAAASESDEAPSPSDIDKIIFACDAGMGSSAMGASLLRKKAKQMDFDMSITNSSISQLSDDQNMLVITQEELTPRARKQAPSATHISVGNFLDGDNYDRLLAEMQGQSETTTSSVDESVAAIDEDNIYADIQTILVAYGEKIPASAMGASILRNKVRGFDRQIKVDTVQVDQLVANNQTLVVVDGRLEDQFKDKLESVNYYKVTALYEDNVYDDLVNKL